ncbi:MAG: T9SS type A sorting domain-containing protein [Muribaculaceae bacterium]
MKMKTLLLAAICLMASAIGQASVVDCLEVVLTSGPCATFLFDRQPEITFVDSKLQITTADDSSVAYDLDDVVDIQFKTFDSTLAADLQSITITATGEGIVVANLPADSSVAVYDLNGRAIIQAVASESFTISRQDLGRGVYVLKINNFATKITLK